MDGILGRRAQKAFRFSRGPSDSLYELLHKPPAQIENYREETVLCAAVVKRLLTYETISIWIRTHPLHRHSDSDAHDQDLVRHIVGHCRLLFAILIKAKLEFVTSTLLSNGKKDDSLLENDWSNLGLNHDEQRRLTEKCYEVCPILQKSPHRYLPERTVLPFTKRVRFSHGSYGQIYSVEVAEGHLESNDTVDILSLHL